MKGIRSLTELSDALDRDLKTRKRELTTLKFQVAGARNQAQDVLASAAICLLYGHWEGFFKYAATCYTNYVSHQGLSYGELSNGIVAICLKSQIKGLRETKKVSLHRDIISRVRDQVSDVPKIPWKAAIETHDNLKSEVLAEILTIVGCKLDRYLLKAAVVDEQLVAHRNAMAHNGNDQTFQSADYIGLHETVVELMGWVRDDIDNAAALKRFTRSEAEPV